MNVEIFSELARSLIQISKLALEVGRIVASLVHAHNGQTGLLEAIALLLERDYKMVKGYGQTMRSKKLSIFDDCLWHLGARILTFGDALMTHN